jgi:transposase
MTPLDLHPAAGHLIGWDVRMGQQREKRTRCSFSVEFKRDAVAQGLDNGRPVAHVAADLGLNDSTLGNWVKTAQ